MALVAGAVVVVLVLRDGGEAVVEGFRYYRGYRRDNALGYFALGILGALVPLVAASVTVPRRALPRWTDVPLQLGRSSLLAFALGSAGLYVLPDGLRRAVGEMGIPGAVAYVVGLIMIVNWRRLIPPVLLGHEHGLPDQAVFEQV